MEKVSGRDLDWFFDQWAYGIGYPTVKVTRGWNEGSKTLTLTVNETQAIDSTHPFFRFPATIRIVTRDSVVRRDIMVTEQGQRFDLPLPAAPVTFRFDEGGWLLGTVTTDQSVAELASWHATTWNSGPVTGPSLNWPSRRTPRPARPASSLC
jgi:aminopeptidase N